jgi:hypothetical protein
VRDYCDSGAVLMATAVKLETIPYGYCHCACGQKTKIATRNDTNAGLVKGEPNRFIAGHFPIRPKLPVEELKALYARCFSLEQIAKQFNVGWGVVRRHLREVGVKIRPDGRVKDSPIAQERRFWRRVNKSGSIPKANPTWTADQELDARAWRWDGFKWIWLLGPCWEWTGGLSGEGYGAFSADSRQITSHRFSYSLKHKIMPVQVCHHCDNKPCVNETHLFPGTAQLNKYDENSKGRTRKGVHHLMYKEIPIKEITVLYQQGLSAKKIGKKFGVDGSVVIDRLRSVGVAVRQPRDFVGQKHSNYRHDISMAEIVRLYESGLNTSAIAARLLGIKLPPVVRRTKKLKAMALLIWHRLRREGYTGRQSKVFSQPTKAA